MHPVPPPEVSYELHSWLVDLGTVKGKQSQNSKPHVLPGRLVANLVSGEAFVDLLNAIFSKHAVKQKLTSHAGQPQQTWTQVAKGLRRMSVELDNAALAALASGDQALVLELLQELHVVYQHWISQEAKRQRRARNRRVQSQQGQQNGYARAGAAGPDASEKRDAQDKRDAAERRHAADKPKEEGAHTSRPHGKRSMPVSADLPLPGSVDVHLDMGRLDVGKQQKPVREVEEDNQQIEQVADAPERKPWDALSSLSPDRDFSMASSAPELLGLSMMQQLRITPSQVQELLAENGRRLLRAFADVEHNVAHLSRWLGSLTHYGGAVAELLLLRPEHTPFTLTVLGHGLQSQSDAGEAACVILAGVCAALAGTHLRKVCADWLINSSGLADVAALMSQRSSAHGPAVSVMVSCYGDSLLQLTSQYLKQTVRGEQEYLAVAHHILRAMLSQKDLAEACHEQGVPSHFLARSLQRLDDERSTAGTLQAAALLATDLWLAGVSTSSPQEGLGDLLSALKTATQSRQGRCPHMVAFSCLARLLSRLCDNQDVEGTPAVYRTFVYALVECESHSSREFGTRCLLNLLEKYEGVPVGILAELSVKKFQVSAAEPLTVIDIELFLVIAKHPRCTDRHAELLAQVLVRCALENPDVGRAASLPLLVIFRRFAREDSLQALFEHFVQVSLTRLIQRGTPKMQVNQVHEVLAKTACMRVPSLDRRMRRLLQEVCKAYLSSYIELHPNLQAVLDLWPEDEQDLKRWAQAIQAEETPQSPAKEEAAPTSVSAGEDFGSHGLELRSISPSVHNDAQPRSHSFADSSTAQVAQLAKETESLRDELAVAKDKQTKALAEAEALRKELGEAKELQKKVEAEVEQLQERREEILARRRQAAAKRGQGEAKARKPAKAEPAASEDLTEEILARRRQAAAKRGQGEAKARKPAKAEPAASEDLTEAAGKEAEHAEQEAEGRPKRQRSRPRKISHRRSWR